MAMATVETLDKETMATAKVMVQTQATVVMAKDMEAMAVVTMAMA